MKKIIYILSDKILSIIVKIKLLLFVMVFGFVESLFYQNIELSFLDEYYRLLKTINSSR